MPSLDHLLLGCADLEAGIQEIYQLSGVKAEPGGPHPGLGTHNALLSLGGQQYLELIAPDPIQSVVNSMTRNLSTLQCSGLIGWAARCSDSDSMQSTIEQAAKQQLNPLPPRQVSRVSPNGHLLNWRIVFIKGTAQGYPFFIDWLDTPHPSGTAPAGCTLSSFTLQTNNFDTLQQDFNALNLDIDLVKNKKNALLATLQCERGEVKLHSHAELLGLE